MEKQQQIKSFIKLIGLNEVLFFFGIRGTRLFARSAKCRIFSGGKLAVYRLLNDVGENDGWIDAGAFRVSGRGEWF